MNNYPSFNHRQKQLIRAIISSFGIVDIPKNPTNNILDYALSGYTPSCWMLENPSVFLSLLYKAGISKWMKKIPGRYEYILYSPSDVEEDKRRLKVVRMMLKVIYDNCLRLDVYENLPVNIKTNWENENIGGIKEFIWCQRRVQDILAGKSNLFKMNDWKDKIKDASLKHQIKSQRTKLEKKKYNRAMELLKFMPPFPEQTEYLIEDVDKSGKPRYSIKKYQAFPGGQIYRDTLDNWNRMQKEEDKENEKRRQSSSRRSMGSSHISSQIEISQIEKQLKQFEKLLKLN